MTGMSNSANNNLVFQIAVVTANSLTLTTLTSGLTAQSVQSSGTVIFYTNDEFTLGNGYGTSGMSGAGIYGTNGGQIIAPLLSEDDTNNWSQVSFPSLSWTGSGGGIGPAESLLLFDAATPDLTIIGNIDFGVTGGVSGSSGATFQITGTTFREI
jgi:hypothetical protein